MHWRQRRRRFFFFLFHATTEDKFVRPRAGGGGEKIELCTSIHTYVCRTWVHLWVVGPTHENHARTRSSSLCGSPPLTPLLSVTHTMCEGQRERERGDVLGCMCVWVALHIRTKSLACEKQKVPEKKWTRIFVWKWDCKYTCIHVRLRGPIVSNRAKGLPICPRVCAIFLPCHVVIGLFGSKGRKCLHV